MRTGNTQGARKDQDLLLPEDPPPSPGNAASRLGVQTRGHNLSAAGVPRPRDGSKEGKKGRDSGWLHSAELLRPEKRCS